jgi:hypothetical protein
MIKRTKNKTLNNIQGFWGWTGLKEKCIISCLVIGRSSTSFATHHPLAQGLEVLSSVMHLLLGQLVSL